MTIAQLAAAIRAAIYSSDSGNITGDQLQEILLEIIGSFINTNDLVFPLSGALGGTGVANTGETITLGGNMTTGGTLTTAGTFATAGNYNQIGAFNFSPTITAATTPTFPAGTGTLAYKENANTWTAAQTVSANLTVDNSGSFSCVGAVTLGATGVTGNITMSDQRNIVLNTGTGTKIGTSALQRLGFWNATPIAQPTTGVASASFSTNTSGLVDDSATFDGYTMGQVVKALRNAGLLA